MDTFEKHYQDIAVGFSAAKVLTLENRSLKRVIDWSSGWAKTVSLAVNGAELSGPGEQFDFMLAGFPPPGLTPEISDYQLQEVTAEKLPPYDGDGVKVSVKVLETLRQLKFSVSYIIYPEIPVMAVDLALASPVQPRNYFNCRGKDKFNAMSYPDLRRRSFIADSCLLPDFTVSKSVELQLHTDSCNEYIIHHLYTGESQLTGSIVLADSAAHKLSFFMLSEAPPSEERQSDAGFDFLVENGNIAGLASGFTSLDIRPGSEVKAHRMVMGFGELNDPQTMIKKYWWTRRPVDRRSGGLSTVNPWGCGKFRQLVSEEFLLDEVRAAGQLGADIYQIDDGYQGGRGLMELALLNRDLPKDWWNISPELLPNGFAPLAEQAAAGNVALSLWFAPGCNVEYRNWRESADILLGHYRKYGIRIFKIDGVMLLTAEAEANFRKFLEALYNDSNGEITVNLDVTNGARGGLCEFSEFGVIFLENRYVSVDWPDHLYHPQDTLRNVWDLAEYFRIQTIQIEVPDPGIVNAGFYQARNIMPPTEYPLDYWFAAALMAAPLLWLAPSTLSDENMAVLQKMTALQKKYRGFWQDANIVPVGRRPDGQSICGFYADSGWLLLFRELDAPAEAKLSLPEFKSCRRVAGNCEVGIAADGTVDLSRAAGWALLEVSSDNEK